MSRIPPLSLAPLFEQAVAFEEQETTTSTFPESPTSAEIMDAIAQATAFFWEQQNSSFGSLASQAGDAADPFPFTNTVVG